MDNNNNLKVNHINPFSKFLIWCSGARVSIFEERDECAVEINRYASIGATICLTALFAFIAASYALYKIFIVDDISVPNVGPGAAFAAEGASVTGGVGAASGLTWTSMMPFILGLLWGITIFNLDRIIVSSMRKTGEWWEQLLVAIPRILVAIIISITIAKPLEVRLFEDRIYLELAETRDEKFDESTGDYDYEIDRDTRILERSTALVDSLTTALPTTDPQYRSALQAWESCVSERRKYWTDNDMGRLQANRNRYDAELRDIQNRLRQEGISEEEQRQLNEERRTTSANLEQAKQAYSRPLGGYIDIRDRCVRLDNEAKSLLAELTDVRNDRLESEQKLRDLTTNTLESNQTERDSVAQVMTVALNRGLNDNFIAQIEALGTLTKDDKSLKYASWMIMFLFILVETAPVFVKLITPRGPYDEAIDLMQDVASNRKDSDVLSSKKIADYRNNIREKCEVEIINNYMKRYASAQIRVNKKRFDRWEQGQINKVNNTNPDDLL